MEDGLVQRGILTLRTEGLNGVWRKVRRRLSKKPVYRRLLVMETSLKNTPPVIEPKIPVTFEELHPSDFDKLIALRPFLTEEVVRLRLKTGHRFYVAKLDGEIVHSCVVAIKKAYIGYLEIAFPLSPREVYFYEVYTVPKYRGNRITPASCSFVMRTMHQLGYRQAVLFVYPHNRPALRAFSKLNYQRKGHIGFVEILGIRRYFYRVRDGGFDRLNNALFVPREKLVPAELQGQIW